MIYQKIRLQINCQKGKTVEAEFPVNQEPLEKDGIRMTASERIVNGCQIGEICLSLIHDDPLSEPFNLAMETPVKVYLPVREYPEKITAMYLFNPWWTRPAFVDSIQDIPQRTQIAFFKYKDRYACLIPMVGSKFKTYLTGGTALEICLEMTACVGGLNQVEEPLYLYTEATTVAKAVHNAFTWLTNEKKILPREKRRLPEMFRYLGWCSWDAFRTDVTEEKLRQKADEFVEKSVPVKWMLIDDGWFSAQDKMLYDFSPDRQKFPNGFQGMVEDIRKKGDILWFGVWHALGGYWGGVAPDSPVAVQEAPYLYLGSNGYIVPSPQNGDGFYRDWCELLTREGIDFIKVDGQSSAPFYFENSLPVSEAAKGMNQALESGAYRMDGAIINCMGMAMENILARPLSAISRNSDDFLPEKEESFTEHLLQNAYNSIYHNEIYCCDWDMFWTKHRYAVKHSLLRAISGGPIYFSDKLGCTEPEVLRPLTYQDGRLLMMDRSAKPTEDCIFSNPLKEGVLKLHNITANGKGGGIAAYNLTGKDQSLAFTPADIPDLEIAEQYWVYDFFAKKVRKLERNKTYTDILEPEGFAWYVIAPFKRNSSCLGLLDKYVGLSAVESVNETENTQTFVLRASGTLGWASDKAPKTVLVNALDMTAEVEQKGALYVLPLSETTNRTILSIIF